MLDYNYVYLNILNYNLQHLSAHVFGLVISSFIIGIIVRVEIVRLISVVVIDTHVKLMRTTQVILGQQEFTKGYT